MDCCLYCHVVLYSTLFYIVVLYSSGLCPRVIQAPFVGRLWKFPRSLEKTSEVSRVSRESFKSSYSIQWNTPTSSSSLELPYQREFCFTDRKTELVEVRLSWRRLSLTNAGLISSRSRVLSC